MPFFTIFAPTSQVWHGIDTSIFQPYGVGYTKGRRKADVKPTVSIKDGGVLTVKLDSFFVGNDHRYLCAILAMVEDLMAFVLIRIKLNFGLYIQFTFA